MTNPTIFGTYNPGWGFMRNPRVFSGTPVLNPISSMLQPHNGDDWGTFGLGGLPVSTAADGVVIWAPPDAQVGDNGVGWGYYAVVLHTRDDGSQYRTLYAHLASPCTLTVGSTVNAGDTIGIAGASGGATGIHLHFEVIDGGVDAGVTAGTRLNPGSFTDWGTGMPHQVDTLADGSKLIMQSTLSGGVRTDYMIVIDKYGVTQHAYDTALTTLYDIGGNITGYTLSAFGPDGETAIKIEIGPDKKEISKTFYGADGTTTYQSGILISSNNLLGTVTVVVPGLDATPGWVNADGSITATPAGSGFSISIPSDPHSSTTITAGGKTFSVPVGGAISQSDVGLLIQNSDSAGYPSLLIYPDGSATQYLVDANGNYLGSTQIGTGSYFPDFIPSADYLSHLAEFLSSEMGTADAAIVNAAEVRNFACAQGGDELWGGAVLMGFGNSSLSNWYNYSTQLYNYNLTNGIDTNDPSNSINGTYGAPYNATYNGANDPFSLASGYGYSVGGYSGLGLIPGFNSSATTTLLNYGSADSNSYVCSATATTSTWPENTNQPAIAPSTNSYGYYIPPFSFSYPSDPFPYVWAGPDYPSDLDTMLAPIVLDLNGNGIEMISKETSNAYFDVKGDGYRHNIG